MKPVLFISTWLLRYLTSGLKKIRCCNRVALLPPILFFVMYGDQCDIMHTLILHVVYNACMYLLVVIYTCINTLPYARGQQQSKITYEILKSLKIF